MKHFIALTCEALARSLYACAANTPNAVSVRLFKQGLHLRPPQLRAVLQAEIDAIEPGECDAILLVYGMCGTATVGLTARHMPLVLPRAHDCITLYLGSHERYQAEFDRHPGTYWYSVDYMERQDPENPIALGGAGMELTDRQYAEYVAKYGQEMADMLAAEMRSWMQHYTRAAFIDMGLGDPTPYEAQARQRAAQEGWAFERKQGDPRLLERLVSADWDPAEFLVVQPGYTIQQSFGEGIVLAQAAERPVDDQAAD